MELIIDPKYELPSFRQYFLSKGCATGDRRIVTHAHKRILKAVSDWFLGRLTSGKRNLSISVPPRYGKTIIVGDMIEYSLGIWPDSEFIYTSYSGDLAVEQVRKVKDTLESDWYRDLFPWMKKPSGQQKYFRTGYGGSVYGVGVGGTITGFVAGKKTRPGFGGGIIIDDPIKADEARSETVRKHTRDWYTGTLLSRRNRKTTPILMIAQRLHPEDLVGHVQQKFGNLWHSVKIPLIEPDATDTIWPDSYDFNEALQLREVDPFAYYSQYQQEPIVPGGTLIKSDWWRFYTDYEAVVRRCDSLILTADTAYGVQDAHDYSVIQCWGFEGAKRIYLLDQIRGKWGYEQLLPIVREFWEKHVHDIHRGIDRPMRLYIENKASGQSLVQQYDTFREWEIDAFPWDAAEYGPKDKVGRVRECVLPIFNGEVILPDTPEATFTDDFMAECAAFSEDMSHSRDDQVDAMTMAVLIWRGIMHGGVPHFEDAAK